MFHNGDGQNHKTVSAQTTTFFEEKGEPKQIRTEAPQLTSPNALPLGQTGSVTSVGKVERVGTYVGFPLSSAFPTRPLSAKQQEFADWPAYRSVA